MKKSILILFTLSFIIGCEPMEVNVKDSFDFQIKSQYISTNKIDTEILTFIDIFPNHIVEGTTYTFEYEIQEGDGFYKLENLVLSPGQKYEFSDLEIVPKYVAKIAGQHQIQTFIENDKGLRKEHKLAYQIIKEDFDFTITFEKNENYVNEFANFIIRLDPKENDEEATYKAYFKNTDGELILLDDEESFRQNEFFDIEGEITQGRFRSLEVNNKEIEFIIESSNGIIRSQKIVYSSLQTDFEVTITPTPLADNYRNGIKFKILILPPKNIEQEITYSMYFTSMNLGNLFLTINNFGEEIITTPGFKVDLGTNPYMNGDLKELGIGNARKGTVTFFFNDSNGANYETTANVEFYD
ncbi:TraQ conjugal transfer family protein [Aquimarina sediminis]|uniref:TraQ conjugal transfer family protein n=1 Tax=Aquimarina sediminis TaxID=2070536 RepID=UPI000FFEDC37|nr:TraQ conjugal transfer family protein [Aquimarina sediminis]